MGRGLHHAVATAVLVVGFFALSTAVLSAQLPEGFSETLVADGIANPTLLNFSPDGRLFVSQQSGALRVIKNGTLQSDPVLSLDVNSAGEHGLLGVAFDPNFSTSPYIYVYYTANKPVKHNRVSRFRLNGDTASSESVLFDFDPMGRSNFHCGGTIKFGPDGKLYVGHGDNAGFPFVANAQRLDNLFGKVVRLNPDGSLPKDNPFYQSNKNNNRAIWIYGLRNPFTFDFLPGVAKVFVNDVGESSWEEINEGTSGGNYGWPKVEGKGTAPGFKDPVYTYAHGTSADQGCAITGGAFYAPKVAAFPTKYLNQYFYIDYCNNWVRTLDPQTHESKPFAQNIASNPVDLRLGPDGALYYLSKWQEGVFRISYKGSHDAYY